MLQVEYSPTALEDMQDIHEYVSSNWDEDIARKLLTKITSDIRRLELYPEVGVDLGKIIDIPTEYRYIFSRKNYIFYRIDQDKIRIIRVLNEKRNCLKILFGISKESEEDNYK